MTSKFTGAESDADREFNARYRDKDGKLLWNKLREDIVASGAKPRSFAEVHREMMDIVRKDEEALKRKQQEGNKDTSDNAA